MNHHDTLRLIDEHLARRQADTERTRRELAAMTVTGGNADRSVTLRVDAAGRLTGLRLTDTAMQLSGDELAEEILRGVAAAHRELAARTTGLVASVYGENSPIARHYSDRFARGTDDD